MPHQLGTVTAMVLPDVKEIYMDPQLTQLLAQNSQLLAQTSQWLTLLTIVTIMGFTLLAGGIISSNIALNRAVRAMWLQLRRQYTDIERDVQEMKDLLRGH
jgi:type II secretory pathway component PulF